MADAFLGLDLGTTGVKAVAFDEDDRELASHVVPTPTTRLTTGAEYDADELWRTAAEVIRSVVAAVTDDGYTPVSIATASMGESGVLLDRAGRPTAPIIAWFDPRTETEATWWADVVGVARTHRIAAIPPRAER